MCGQLNSKTKIKLNILRLTDGIPQTAVLGQKVKCQGEDFQEVMGRKKCDKTSERKATVTSLDRFNFSKSRSKGVFFLHCLREKAQTNFGAL